MATLAIFRPARTGSCRSSSREVSKGERQILNYRRGLASRPDCDVVFRKRRRALQARFPGFPLLAVSRPQPKRASESRALPSHNSIVTSAINSRRSRPFNRRAAERINSSSGDSNNMIPTFHGTFMRRTRPAVPPSGGKLPPAPAVYRARTRGKKGNSRKTLDATGPDPGGWPGLRSADGIFFRTHAGAQPFSLKRLKCTPPSYRFRPGASKNPLTRFCRAVIIEFVGNGYRHAGPVRPGKM